MNWLISDALAEQAPAAAGQAGSMLGLLPFVALFVIFYFLLIRPQTKRAKEHRQLVASLGKGDDVVTAGGIVGRIRELDDNFVMVEVADGVAVKVQRHAIQTVLPKGTVDKDKK